MPSSRQATITRIAISPRLAIRIFLNIAPCLDGEQPFAVLNGLTVLDVDLHDLAAVLGVDLVHQLHRLDDAEYVALFYGGSHIDEWRGARLCRPEERADDRR